MMILTLFGAAVAQQVTSGGAVPEGLNVQTFRPSVDAQRMLWTNDTLLAPNGTTSGRVLLSYANDPLIYTSDFSDERSELLSDVVQMDLLGAHTRGPVRFGLDVPLLLRSVGDVTGGETGLGDITAQARWTALDRSQAPLGGALGLNVILPTATVDAPLGIGGLGWELEGIVDKELGDVLLALNVSHRGQPEVQLENLEWDDQLQTRLGAGYALSDASGLSGELSTAVTYASVGEGGVPAEILAGGYRRVGGDLVMRGGVGAGLNSAVGTPKFRLVLALGYEPPAESDRDADGLADGMDACPDRPEDFDQVDDADGCPEPTAVSVSVIDGSGAPVPGASWSLGSASGEGDGSAELFGGSYSLSVSAPGYTSVSREEAIPDATGHAVLVTMEAEARPGDIRVTVVDTDGAPIEAARWKLGRTEVGEQAPGATASIEEGDYNLVVLAEGYLTQRSRVSVAYGQLTEVAITMEASRATVRGEQIDIEGSVYFETARSVIKRQSHALLDDVAAIMVAHPELTRVRIEGHTDSRGDAAYNKQLSQDRADAVKAYLVSKGVADERLESVGYGEENPLVSGNNEGAWSKNRRVDFIVVDREEQ